MKNEGLHSDGYSLKAYRETSEQLSIKEAEERTKSEPFLKDLAAHEELRKETPAPYADATEEEALRIAYEKETKEVRAEVERIKENLHRLFENARTIATTMNEQRESDKELQRVLPEIEKMEKATSIALGISPDDGTEEGQSPKPPVSPEELSRLARAYGYAVLQTAEDAKGIITSHKPTPTSVTISKVFDDLQDLYKNFTKSLTGNPLGQDRFGRATR